MHDSSLVSESNLTDSEEIIQNNDIANNINQDFDFDEDKIHIGFIAQELKEVYPELTAEDNQGYLSIDYISLIPILIEALKEQQTQIKELESLINKAKLKSTGDITLSNTSELFQNQPNPFCENTYINYFIPDEVNKAVIYIYNLQGRQVKVIDINERGQGSAIIYGSELYAGTYHYTLVTDGQIVGTYTMILTD